MSPTHQLVLFLLLLSLRLASASPNPPPIKREARANGASKGSPTPPRGHLRLKSLSGAIDYGFLSRPESAPLPPPDADYEDISDEEEDIDLLSYQAGSSLRNAMEVLLEPNSLFSNSYNILAKTGGSQFAYLGASGSEDGFSSSVGLASALDVAFAITVEGTPGAKSAMKALEDNMIESATWKLNNDKTLRATYHDREDKARHATLFYIDDPSFPMKTLGLTGDMPRLLAFLKDQFTIHEVVFHFVSSH